MTNELTLIVEENKLPTEKTEALLASFGGFFKEAKEKTQLAKDIVVTNEDQTDLMIHTGS